MARVFVLLLLASLLSGCGGSVATTGPAPEPAPGPAPGPAPEKKPDVTLGMEAFLKDLRTDEKSARTRYTGKEVELTATVMGVVSESPFPVIMVVAETEPTSGLVVSQDFHLRRADAGKEKQLRLLSRGQKVTIRGKGIEFPVQYGLDDLRVVDSGPSPVEVTTVANIAKIEKDVAALKKYYTQEVLVRVKVTELREKDALYLGQVTDPDAPAGTKGVLVRRPVHGNFKKELEELKVGDVVTIIAAVEGEMMPLAFYGARIITEAPAGVKMPGAK